LPEDKKSDRWLGLFKPSELLWAALFFVSLALLAGWKIILMLMGALLFHEFGHAWAMSRYGLGVRGFYFLPFAGLAVAPLRPWTSRRQETVIALMGPIWGLAMALALSAAYLATGSPVLAGIIGVVAVINLFNLIPLNPLDGGRVIKSLGHSVWSGLGLGIQALGIAAAIVVAVYWSPIVGVLVAVMAALELVGEIRNLRRQADRKQLIAELADLFETEATADSVAAALLEIGRKQSDSSESPGSIPAESMERNQLLKYITFDQVPESMPLRDVGIFLVLYLALAGILVSVYFWATSHQSLVEFFRMMR
jgi:Zn-dependent protease